LEARPLIRILVADDHPVVRDGLVAILSTQADFAVIGEAGGGAEAIRKTLETRPDVLLLDLEMPEVDGVEVLRRLREAGSAAKALVFTAYDTDERILASLRLGARGYLLKGAPREEVFQAIRIVAGGGSLLEPEVARKIIEQVSGGNGSGDEEPAVEPLTPRELEILEALAQGKANKTIALELGVTERTVKFHVSSILAKLGAGNRTEAVRRAVRLKMVRL
jgi:DNA-binding NarL/FixJ family response regulator